MRLATGCPGLTVHRFEPAADELTFIRGMCVTNPARTAFDLGRRADRTEALVRCDMLAHTTGLTARDVMPLLDRYRGAPGSVQLREVLDLMDNGAESPPETRTRLALIDAGLRRPQTQIRVRDATSYLVARIDMGYEEFRSALSTTVTGTGRTPSVARPMWSVGSRWPNSAGRSSTSPPTC